MFKRVIKTMFWISLVGLMLVVPLAGFITVTSTTQAEANALKVKIQEIPSLQIQKALPSTQP